MLSVKLQLRFTCLSGIANGYFSYSLMNPQTTTSIVWFCEPLPHHSLYCPQREEIISDACRLAVVYLQKKISHTFHSTMNSDNGVFMLVESIKGFSHMSIISSHPPLLFYSLSFPEKVHILICLSFFSSCLLIRALILLVYLNEQN